MTDIAFHVNVPDRLAYACRLLRKAVRRNARVVVAGPAPLLGQLDRQLFSSSTAPPPPSPPPLPPGRGAPFAGHPRLAG
jgi:DNA polymerase III subunit chi